MPKRKAVTDPLPFDPHKFPCFNCEADVALKMLVDHATVYGVSTISTVLRAITKVAEQMSQKFEKLYTCYDIKDIVAVYRERYLRYETFVAKTDVFYDPDADKFSVGDVYYEQKKMLSEFWPNEHKVEKKFMKHGFHNYKGLHILFKRLKFYLLHGEPPEHDQDPAYFAQTDSEYGAYDPYCNDDDDGTSGS